MGLDFAIAKTLDRDEEGCLASRVEYDQDRRVRWSYSGFHRFRQIIASLSGIDLDSMIGFGGDKEWPHSAAVPMVHLLHHSDCDGELTWEQCAAVAMELRDLLPRIEDAWDRVAAGKLADMMDFAARERAFLVFC